MSKSDTSIQEQLKQLNWSIDDLLAHVIIMCYKEIKDTAVKKYPDGWSKYDLRKKYIYEEIVNIPITRQTLYNMISTKRKTTLNKATLVRDVINEARKLKDKNSKILDFSELNIYIYGNKTK